MKTLLSFVVLAAFACVSTSSSLGYKESTVSPLDELKFSTFDESILRTLFVNEINEYRTKKGNSSLAENNDLQLVARQIQSELEFKPFRNAKKIRAKINKRLPQKITEVKYKGGLSTNISSQFNALKFNKKELFFRDKTDSTSWSRLYRGSKKNRTALLSFTYKEFVNEVFTTLKKKKKKVLFSESFQDIGLLFQWDYKSLHKKKIPTIKLVVILGGYQTATIDK